MPSKRKRSAVDLRRKRGTRRERSRILIVTEGKVTEVQYIKGLVNYMNASGASTVAAKVKGEGRPPIRVVKKALNLTKNGREIGRREGYDAVWCVFDVDYHDALETAVDEAIGAGFNVAVSNPCFEVWILWHFEDYRSELTAIEACKRLRKHGIDGKELPKNFDYARHSEAERRAATSSIAHVPQNPGSGVGKLSAALRSS